MSQLSSTQDRTAPIPVSTTDEAGIRVVRIDRPLRRNALNLDTKQKLTAALLEADADENVSVIVLTGSSEVFVAGTDIAEMATFSATDLVVKKAGEVFEVLDNVSKPTIAAVEGYALGGGCELALATDIVIAGDDAKFGQPEIRVGLIPGAGGIHRLMRMAGRQRALRLLLTGDHFDAREAFDLGIVSEIVKSGTAYDRALELASQLMGLPPLSLKFIKELSRNAENSPLRSGLQLERRTFQLVFDSEDHHEGLQAFLERRPPKYQGK